MKTHKTTDVTVPVFFEIDNDFIAKLKKVCDRTSKVQMTKAEFLELQQRFNFTVYRNINNEVLNTMWGVRIQIVDN